MPGAMKHQTALLLGRLGRHKSHVWPGDRFANRFRISRIILLSFDIGFHVGGRHQAHGVAQRLKFTRPIMRRRTGLDTNEARRQLLKERQHIPPLQLTANNNIAIRINAVDLKNRLRDIETDSRNGSHDLAPPNHRRLTAPTSMALSRRWRSRPQHQFQTRAVQRTSATSDPVPLQGPPRYAPSIKREGFRMQRRDFIAGLGAAVHLKSATRVTLERSLLIPPYGDGEAG